MNQRKVSTRTREPTAKTKKILVCLNNYPEGATPKIIARETGLNVNTIKSLLPKIPGVKKAMRGFYKVLNNGDSHHDSPSSRLTSWNFHNCILSSTIARPPPRLIEESYAIGLIAVKFSLSPLGNATLRISTEHPLNVSSLSLAGVLFSVLLKDHSPTPITAKDIYIKTIEFNKDYSNLRLDGVRAITLDSLSSHFKAYQKQLGLRIEHKTKVPFTVENVVDMLAANPNSMEYNIKLSKQKEQLDNLMTVTTRNTELLFKLLDKIRVDDR